MQPCKVAFVLATQAHTDDRMQSNSISKSNSEYVTWQNPADAFSDDL